MHFPGLAALATAVALLAAHPAAAQGAAPAGVAFAAHAKPPARKLAPAKHAVLRRAPAHPPAHHAIIRKSAAAHPFARVESSLEAGPRLRLAAQPPIDVTAAALAPPPGIAEAPPRRPAPAFAAEAPRPGLSALLGETEIPGAPPIVLPPSLTPPTPAILAAPIPPEPASPMCVENADIATLQAALTARTTTATALVQAYLARIAAYDRAGPMLNSIRETNPDALAIAARIDAEPPRSTHRLPLEGIPILLKDNIATDDHQHTTAGSLALAGARAKRDATVAARLRRAGAIILGKANLTEFANILAVGMPSGYSSLGGQVRNPYAPALDAKGIPIVPTGGSSAGSAVAVAAGLAAASIGTETSGSLLSPASQNGLVTIKPTLGLVSAAGIIPIAHSQDVAGPMTRTVRDAALILSAIAGPDPADPATAHSPAGIDYTKYLDAGALRGKRIGVPSDPADPPNDVYYGPLSPRAAAVMADVIKTLEAQGAVVIRQNMPTEAWIGGPGTKMSILDRNPESPEFGKPVQRPIVFVYELKHDMNLYLKDWATDTTIHSLGDIIAFNAAHAARALRFGQDIFLAADSTSGTLTEPEYLSARRMDLRAARDLGLDAYIEENRLDAVLFPGTSGAAIAAAAGYPSIQVPAGFISGLGGQDTPDYPLGATFTGRAFSEPTLIAIAYAYEQASHARHMPPGVPALAGCGK